MFRTIIAGALAVAFIGCGDTPGGDHDAGKVYIRAYVEACEDHGGVIDSSPDGHFQSAYVICQDQTGFYWNDDILVEVR